MSRPSFDTAAPPVGRRAFDRALAWEFEQGAAAATNASAAAIARRYAAGGASEE